jgi:hypothetical protein
MSYFFTIYFALAGSSQPYISLYVYSGLDISPISMYRYFLVLSIFVLVFIILERLTIDEYPAV